MEHTLSWSSDNLDRDAFKRVFGNYPEDLKSFPELKAYPIFHRNNLLMPVGQFEMQSDDMWIITIKSGLPAPICTNTMEPIFIDGELDHWICD
ncbi:MAG TPA: hypothetical protein VEZ55_06910 [Chitinophagaceae bacterium]|nr:hypothetical protein [Chitinophagaceae bacterium]